MDVANFAVLLLFFSPALAAFDYFKIAETWPATLCSMKPCVHETTPNHFTIHGLWPSNYTRPHPSYCSHTDFEFAEVEELDNIYSYWPNLLGEEYTLWKEQWEKHGTCSNMDQDDYFQLALDIYATYDITDILGEKGIVPSDTFTYNRVGIIEAIAEYIGEDPQLDCENSGQYLYEVRLCLNRNNRYISCTPTSTNCKKSIYYPSVDVNKQTNFAMVEKRGSGNTRTMREDAAKYLINLDVSSTHYDTKSRSMREDPLLDADPHEIFYGEAAVARSKYDEDVYFKNHTTVWGTGVEAAEAPSDPMKANIACKEVAVDGGQCIQRSIHQLVVDEKSLAEPFGKKDQTKIEEKDDKTIDLGSS